MLWGSWAMKKSIKILCVSILLTSGLQAIEPSLFSLSTTATWQEFSLKNQSPTSATHKWAWIGLITLKSKEPLTLERLTLQWNGKKIKKMSASLYQKKKEKDPTLIPIQDNLVCDGIWNPAQQQLTFFLNKKVVAVNKYYLVLNYPVKVEDTVKHGHFSLKRQHGVRLLTLARRAHFYDAIGTSRNKKS